MNNLAVLDGKAYPLGATLSEQGCNFAVHCPDAKQVFLCLFDAQSEEQIACIALPAKTGKVWHGFVEGIVAGQYYGFRTVGINKAEFGLRFDFEKLLIDPYARCLSKAQLWNAEQYEGDSHELIAKSVVVADDFQWDEYVSCPHGLADTVIYEAHVKGLTQTHPDLPDSLRGKYLGVCHPSMLRHYAHLGVTTLQLMPVFAFMPEPFITQKGLTNYWGYNPINFFSPDWRYADKHPVNEFKTMVKTLHEHNIEVVLDVVYNHTAESGLDGPILSFKGFDNKGCYLYALNEMGAVDYTRYENNSGCGNSIHTAHPFMFTLIMDSLRYWVSEMGVDGFRFDLAASLAREPYEFSPISGLLRAIRQDPVLKNCKLIAEPWDIGNGGYRLGQFPSHWLEVNDKYRDHVRSFWRGDRGVTGEFATRLLGSRDIFPKNHRFVHTSVNHVTYHDGFTLHDLVSYTERHNEDNLEQNRDGHQHNLSFNCGAEGPTDNNKVNQLRQRQKRNLFATLMLSQGTPHMLGGDELGRTQNGNNNAYCQDNSISWFDWTLNSEQQDFLDFCCFMIGLRKESTLLNNLQLVDDEYALSNNVERVGWYRPDGCRKVIDDWHDPDNQAFAVEYVGTPETGEHWLMVFNASEHDVMFILPALPVQQGWQRVLDTCYSNPTLMPDLCALGVYKLKQQSVCLFKQSAT